MSSGPHPLPLTPHTSHLNFLVRLGTVADSAAIARHRAQMFVDMGTLPVARYDDLVAATIAYLERAIPAGEYVAWVAAPVDDPNAIVAGAGAQVRSVLPHPLQTSGDVVVAEGRQAIVVNVFTEPDWRRRGAAALLMEHVLEWARTTRLDTLVLHASDDGRALYERLGFEGTNEMRYMGDLHSRRD